MNLKAKLIGLMLLGAVSAYAQTGAIGTNTYEGLSLKDLLGIKIVSVSKKSEALFDAPLSASVLTREQIRRAG